MVDIIFHYPFLGAMGDHSKKKPGTAMCVGCGSQIHDQFILRVSPDLEWHAACLKCAECSQYLESGSESRRLREPEARQGECQRQRARGGRAATGPGNLQPDGGDLGTETQGQAGRARSERWRPIHAPGRVFATHGAALSEWALNEGEGPSLLGPRERETNPSSRAALRAGSASKRNEIGPRRARPPQGWAPRVGGGPSLTSRPYPVLADAGSGRQPSLRPHVHKQTEKTTRVRTVLNEKQLHTLRTCYAANPRPDALMKEQLVEMTGLSPRVIRVWFQNKRCKDKKKSILMKQLQQQQHNDKTSLQGLTGTPLVAGSPIRHESAVQGSAVEVQTYQPPWKALSEFALQSDLDQPAFQQLVSFSESGSLGNSSGSDVTSLSSQLPDTPNSMVPSPVET
ncbi:PREDICTED: insulin gene enhancer protein ISL-2-like [Galeopterus variegatus]|uniref:Insulin gene enhancer protein ISL-2-like n=1 Tax=Galeopterus variegatus TaxID=482537 RepID=A0ABM0QVN0_GALVR|nr:PREDICTED: insulin gene enhancer protein ISL-2-like [Galeopterus variegatus]